MTTRENDKRAPPPPRESMADAVTLEEQATSSASEPSDEPAPSVVTLEREPPSPPPRESMAGAVTLESEARPRFAQMIAASDVGDVASVLVPATQENQHAPAAAPRESMAGAVTREENVPRAEERSRTEVEGPARTVEAPPPAVRALPSRPRLRASFQYDAEDRALVELVLMNERRELIHRFVLIAEPGGALARMFEGLVNVAVQTAAHEGVFGARK